MRRVLLFAGLAIGGVALVGTALLRGWTGAPLDLAMEFGVGAVAVVVIDAVLLGRIQRTLDAAAGSTASAVEIQLPGRDRRPGIAVVPDE